MRAPPGYFPHKLIDKRIKQHDNQALETYPDAIQTENQAHQSQIPNTPCSDQAFRT